MDSLNEILYGLHDNGINRSLAIMGGEPLCEENLFLTYLVVSTVKEKSPDTKIYIWTGYYFDHLPSNPKVQQILKLADVLIDGPFLEELRDTTLPLRGSSNQHIIDLTDY